MKRRKLGIVMMLVAILVVNTFASKGAVLAETTVRKEELRTPSGIPEGKIGVAIEQYIQENQNKLASVAVGVFRGDETIYETQAGYSDVEQQTLANQDTVYEWGSVSKLLVWVSVMQLWEQGKLDLETDIKDYLPKDFFQKLSYDDPITMLDLMNHQGGWQETTVELEVTKKEEIVDLETALHITEPIQSFRPGTVTSYSNWGAALAAYIVERISNEEFVSYVHHHIFEPLGMEHTAFAPDYSDTPWVQEQRNHLKCYSFETDERKSLGEDIRYILVYPAGSATGTYQDFLTFAKSFVTPSATVPLFQNPSTLDVMKEATAYYGTSDIKKVCHGMWTQFFAVDVMGHTGNTNGCSSSLMFDERTGLGAVVLTNVQGEVTFCQGLNTLIFGEFKDNPHAIDAQTNEDELGGWYYISRSFLKGRYSLLKYVGATMSVSKAEDGSFQLPGGIKLKYYGNHQYIMEQGEMQLFVYAAKDENGKMSLQTLSMDFIEQSTSSAIMGYVGIGIFIVSVMICFILLLVQLIKRLHRKLHKKQQGKQLWLKIVMEVQNVIVGICVIGLIILPVLSGNFNIGPVMLECIIIMVAAILTLIWVGGTIVIGRKQQLKKTKMVGMLLLAGMTTYISAFTMYWSLYNFWQ